MASSGSHPIKHTELEHQVLLFTGPLFLTSVIHYLSTIPCIQAYENDFIFFVQVLEGVIKYRWNVLPVEQRDGMKNYISDVIVKV